MSGQAPLSESRVSTSSSHTLTVEDNVQNKKDVGPKLNKPVVLTDKDYGLRKRPWRRYRTPWEHIINHHYEGEGTEEKPYIVDWLPEAKQSTGTGQTRGKSTKDITGDPENPMTWGQAYKWGITAVVAMTTLAVAMASSTLSGATHSIAHSFPNYANQVYVLVTSGFVLGFVVGPLLWAPMSEVLGRRMLFVITYVLYTIFNGGVVASQNIWTMIILRFLAGTAGSSPLTNAGGTISDIFDAGQRGLGMALFSAAPFLGPALGPIVGGFLGEAGGWRWVEGLIAIFTAILTVFGFFMIPETYAPVLLKKRAAKLSEATGHVYRSKYEKDRRIAIGELFKGALSRPWALLFKEPIVFLLSLYLAIVYATLYMLFGAFPIVFQQLRGWSPGVSGLAFIGVLVGFNLALLYTILIENPRYNRNLVKAGGFLPAEQRLHPAMLGGLMLPIGLFSFAWTAAPASIHWIAPIICSAPFGFGMVLVFLSVFNYLIDSYLLYAASVLAANSVLRSLFGVGFPLFVAPMFKNLGINWASTLIAFLALACAPLPFLFYVWGARIRRKSKFARQADDLAQMMRAAALAKRGGGDAEKGQAQAESLANNPERNIDVQSETDLAPISLQREITIERQRTQERERHEHEHRDI